MTMTPPLRWLMCTVRRPSPVALRRSRRSAGIQRMRIFPGRLALHYNRWGAAKDVGLEAKRGDKKASDMALDTRTRLHGAGRWWVAHRAAGAASGHRARASRAPVARDALDRHRRYALPGQRSPRSDRRLLPNR